MVVNSFIFWIVYPFLFVFYWIIPSSYISLRKWYLIVVSYLMYMSFYYRYAIILLYVTLVTYFAGICLEHSKKRRKWIHIIFIVVSIFPLFSFKYLNFFCESLSEFGSLLGFEFEVRGLKWLVPIGLSFFSLQAIGYQIDVYYHKIQAERSISDYILFVSFFPLIVSGPICKASEMLPQFKERKKYNYQLAKRGMKLILWGLFMKLVIADRAGLVVNFVYNDYTAFSGSECFLAAILYSLQIYTDFAGYSLMAIGIANTLGYHIVNNFNRPYFSLSVTDFWHRWHISLSRWLKDYIYIPLGGSRCKKSRNYLNIIITFFVSGVWHGANWTFIFWGMIHGLSQVIEKALGCQNVIGKKCFYRCWRIFLTFTIVTFAWIFFRLPTLDDGFAVVAKIATDYASPTKIVTDPNFLYLMFVLPILVAYDVWREFFPSRFSVIRTHAMQWFFCIIITLIILSVGVLDKGQFIYASF